MKVKAQQGIEKTMSNLDDIFEQAAYRSTTGYLSRTAEKTGEELAKELLSDSEFRQDLLQRMRAAVRHTIDTLKAPTIAELYDVIQQLQAQVQQQNAQIQELLKRNGKP